MGIKDEIISRIFCAGRRRDCSLLRRLLKRKRRFRATPASSGRAPSKAWPGRNRRTTRYNFSSYFTENKEILECPYVVIKEDSKGTIWAGTTTNGVIRVVGNSLHPEKINFKKYSLDNGSLNAINVQCLFEDSKKRLWAGTSGGGLNLYDPKSDTFISVNDLLISQLILSSIYRRMVMAICGSGPMSVW